MSNQIELQNVQKIHSIQNQHIGSCEVIQADGNFYIVKEITYSLKKSINQKIDLIKFIQSQEINEMQQFLGEVFLWGKNYLLFEYFDYNLDDLFKTNQRNTFFLKEDQLFALFQKLQFFLNKVKKCKFFYNFLSRKTIYVDNQGELRIANLFMFDEFYQKNDFSFQTCFYYLNVQEKIMGEIILELASLVELRDYENRVNLDNIDKALKIVKQRYSDIFYQLCFQFNFGVDAEKKNMDFKESQYFRLNKFIQDPLVENTLDNTIMQSNEFNMKNQNYLKQNANPLDNSGYQIFSDKISKNTFILNTDPDVQSNNNSIRQSYRSQINENSNIKESILKSLHNFEQTQQINVQNKVSNHKNLNPMIIETYPYNNKTYEQNNIGNQNKSNINTSNMNDSDFFEINKPKNIEFQNYNFNEESYFKFKEVSPDKFTKKTQLHVPQYIYTPQKLDLSQYQKEDDTKNYKVIRNVTTRTFYDKKEKSRKVCVKQLKNGKNQIEYKSKS